MRFSCFKTQYGRVTVVSSSKGLMRVILPVDDKKEILNTIGVLAERREEDLSEVRKALINYFNGEKTDFDFPLDLSVYTSFQRDVWNAARSIPYGQLRNYGWLANQIGRPQAARAVGQALGANPLPIIIPCHRIIRSDGSLGGFSGGLHWKKKLINLEKAVFVP